MEASLQVKNLTKQYPGFLLDHVSFSLPKGAIMGLIGENGAGKSTTINAILDLIHKDEGQVSFWGQELATTPALKEDIGVVFDGINFYETLTPAQVGRISAEAYRQWDNNLYQNYLPRFQLPLSKPIKSFSKGMKTKLCIAVARCGAEQFAAIDPKDVLAWRREEYQYSVLVADKEAARRKYRQTVVDDATIDDILLLYVKGEQKK